MSDGGKKPICHFFSVYIITIYFFVLYTYPQNTGAWGQDRSPPPPPIWTPGVVGAFFERNSFIGMYTACFIQNICKLIENKRFILKKLFLYATGGGGCQIEKLLSIQKCKLKCEKMTSPLKYIFKETIRILNFWYTPFIYI